MKCRFCGGNLSHTENQVGGFDHKCDKCKRVITGLLNNCPECSDGTKGESREIDPFFKKSK